MSTTDNIMKKPGFLSRHVHAYSTEGEDSWSGNERSEAKSSTATFHAEAAMPTKYGNFMVRSYRLVGNDEYSQRDEKVRAGQSRRSEATTANRELP